MAQTATGSNWTRDIAELCKEFELHASQVVEWKRQLLEGAADVFGKDQHGAPPVD